MNVNETELRELFTYVGDVRLVEIKVLVINTRTGKEVVDAGIAHFLVGR